MKTEIGSYEAKTRLPELLREVRAGRSFTITKHGEAVADLVPASGSRKKNRSLAIKKLKLLMEEKPVHGVDIKALIEEGRA